MIVNPSTTIRYSIPKKGLVILKLYKILGEEVKTLLNENREAGYHTINFDASGFASGIYLYKLRVGDFIQIKKMILMR